MQSMNEIYTRITSDYRKLQSEHETAKATALEILYSDYPRIEEIDREISTLAITSAKKVLEEKISPEQAADFVKNEADRLRSERASILLRNNVNEYVPKYKCDLCNDSGVSSDGKKCGCFIRRLQALMALPGERADMSPIKNCTFENYTNAYYSKEIDPDIGCSTYDVMNMVYANCLKFANDFTGIKSGNLLMYGPSGLGKSFMAGCVANRVSDNGFFVMYKSSYKLFQFLEDYKFGKIDRDAYQAVYDAVYDCDLLVIDDFGTEFITSYTQTVFFDLLNSRLNFDKSTIISTNLPLQKISEIYQERVYSRLINEFSVLRFAGTDIRSQKNNR